MGRIRAFACDNSQCAYTTRTEADLRYKAKVTIASERGVTVKTDTPECLLNAVDQALYIRPIPTDPTDEEIDARIEGEQARLDDVDDES